MGEISRGKTKKIKRLALMIKVHELPPKML